MSIAVSKRARIERLERAALGDDVLRLEDLVQDGPMREGRLSPHLAKACAALEAMLVAEERDRGAA